MLKVPQSKEPVPDQPVAVVSASALPSPSYALIALADTYHSGTLFEPLEATPDVQRNERS